MTAYEEFKYDDDGQITAVMPASPGSVRTEQIALYCQTLITERLRFMNEDGKDAWDSGYNSGYFDAVDQIMDDFTKIFDVTICKDVL